jgi:hypothetical protein
MARVIRWRFTKEAGTNGSSFKADAITQVMIPRFLRYWDVDFQQLTTMAGTPHVTFRLTTRTVSTMWTNGPVIHINAKFKWGTSLAAREQMGLCLCHEVGHWLSPSNPIHAASVGNVMFAQVGDPYLNWTLVDMKWFGMLPWRSTLRPWHEKTHWYPLPKVAMGLSGHEDHEILEPIVLGCGKNHRKN